MALDDNGRPKRFSAKSWVTQRLQKRKDELETRHWKDLLMTRLGAETAEVLEWLQRNARFVTEVTVERAVTEPSITYVYITLGNGPDAFVQQIGVASQELLARVMRIVGGRQSYAYSSWNEAAQSHSTWDEAVPVLPLWTPAPVEDPNKFEDITIDPNNPLKEAIMGFSKQKRALPANVKDVKFIELSTEHAAMLAQWMGVRDSMHRAFKQGGREQARSFLKEACARDWDRAQQGYEINVLGKRDDAMDKEMAESDVVKALYSTTASLLQEHIESIDQRTDAAMERSYKGYEKKLVEYAKDAIDRAAEKKAPLIIKEGGKVRKVKGVLPPEFERMVQLASARIPIMLVGPAGCGKTYLCEKLAEALDMEFSDQSCSEGMSESVFNGLLLPIDKGGAFKHVSTPFMDRYEGGGVQLLDEIDAGDPNLFTYINKAIANSSYTVPQRWEKPVVKKHKDFVLVAAANTFGHGADAMYVGRNQLDAATLDRFKVGLITMDYNRDVEQSLAPQPLCDWAWSLRDKIRANKLRRVMSTRVIENLAKMTDQYDWEQKDWEQAYFTGWSDADRRLVS